MGIIAGVIHRRLGTFFGASSAGIFKIQAMFHDLSMFLAARVTSAGYSYVPGVYTTPAPLQRDRD